MHSPQDSPISIYDRKIYPTNLENQRIKTSNVSCQIYVQPEAPLLALDVRLTLKTPVKTINFY